MDDYLNKGGRVLTTAKVDRLLTADIQQLRIDPVRKPTAQYTTLCDTGSQLQYMTERLVKAKAAIQKESKELYYILLLQFENALRISEVLQISPKDIDQLGNVCIRGKKGSKSKIIGTGEAREYLLQCRKNQVYPFTTFNRFFVYRVYKKYNLVLSLPGKSKCAVTHAARHLAAAAGRQAKFEETTISSHLSHKSIKSTTHYGK